jgi:ethanolamine utilization protein EutP (predicted NTPase)
LSQKLEVFAIDDANISCVNKLSQTLGNRSKKYRDVKGLYYDIDKSIVDLNDLKVVIIHLGALSPLRELPAKINELKDRLRDLGNIPLIGFSEGPDYIQSARANFPDILAYTQSGLCDLINNCLKIDQGNVLNCILERIDIKKRYDKLFEDVYNIISNIQLAFSNKIDIDTLGEYLRSFRVQVKTMPQTIADSPEINESLMKISDAWNNFKNALKQSDREKISNYGVLISQELNNILEKVRKYEGFSSNR